jgi:hypothetical protein
MAVEKVRSGSRLRIRARDWNQIADAANAFAAGQVGQTVDPAAGPQHGIVVPVHNASGEDRDRFEVLGIKGATFSPLTDLPAFQSTVVFEGDTPTEPSHVGKFVVLLEPLADDAIGRAIIAGPVAVQISVEDNSQADRADISDGQAEYLATGPSGGAQVLWRAGGTGLQWAYVLLGTPSGPPNGTLAGPLHQMRDIGGATLRQVWDWARMHG